MYTRIEELKEEADIKVQVTYIEIYNEEIKDLIHAVEGRPARPLKVRLMSVIVYSVTVSSGVGRK